MKLNANNDERLTINDIVNEYNGKVKSTTINNYIKKGILKGSMEFGKWFVKRSDLEEYRNQQNTKHNQPIKHKPTPAPKISNHNDIYNEVMSKFNN